MKQLYTLSFQLLHVLHRPVMLLLLLYLWGCGTTAEQDASTATIPALPVMKVSTADIVTYQEFPATLEGRANIEIRPQVEGYLENIFVDEGAAVRKGQPLFQIDERSYQEQLANANASLLSANANRDKAALEVARLTPLVENKVISEVQLKTAQSVYESAIASVEQAQAMVSAARTNLSRTLIKAPVEGYIGRLPYKPGSLVGRAETEPLTLLSDVSELYAYFSMSETDFLQFTEQASGLNLEDKLKQLPPVELLLSNNHLYKEKGKIEMVAGQFNKAMGTISFRAIFPNPQGLLRSGITGRIRIQQPHNNTIVVPQEATFERQDKVFVFALADSNKVQSRPLQIMGKRGNYYLVGDGIRPGDQIVRDGLDRLQDGDIIAPKLVAQDSTKLSSAL